MIAQAFAYQIPYRLRGGRRGWQTVHVQGIDQADADRRCIEKYGSRPIRRADTQEVIWDRKRGRVQKA